MSTATPEPPHKVQRKSNGMTEVHGNALGSVHSKEDRLTRLPPELFMMIIEETMDPDNHAQLVKMLKKRSVSRLFNVEIINAVIKIRNRDGAMPFWTPSGPRFLKIVLLQTRFEAEPHSQSLMLNLIRLVVKRIQDIQGDWSESNHHKWLDATCTCIVHQRRLDLLTSIQTTIDQIGDVEWASQDKIQYYCWVIAARAGDISLLKTIQSQDIGSPPHHEVGFMGTVRWSGPLKRLQPTTRAVQLLMLSYRPEEAALDAHCLPAFELILPRLQPGSMSAAVNTKIHIRGMVDWVKLYWESNWEAKPCSFVNNALASVCKLGKRNRVEVCEVLIKAGASVNGDPQLSTKSNPLTLAISSKNQRVVRFLIKNGAETRAARLKAGGWTDVDPLITAIECQNVGAVEALLECGTWETRTSKSALLAAVKADPAPYMSGKIHILKLLLKDFNPGRTKRTAQMGRGAVGRARSDCQWTMMRMLLDHGCEPELSKRPKTKVQDVGETDTDRLLNGA